jgi:hypothetical protein
MSKKITILQIPQKAVVPQKRVVQRRVVQRRVAAQK